MPPLRVVYEVVQVTAVFSRFVAVSGRGMSSWHFNGSAGNQGVDSVGVRSSLVQIDHQKTMSRKLKIREINISL